MAALHRYEHDGMTVYSAEPLSPEALAAHVASRRALRAAELREPDPAARAGAEHLRDLWDAETAPPTRAAAE